MPNPVFAFLAFTSGSYEGAIVRDMRLANALHARGFKVHIYWMMETNRSLVTPGIRQRMLVRGTRYQSKKPSNLFDTLGRALAMYPAQRRRRFMQQHPDYVTRLMCNFIQTMCDGDAALENRLAGYLKADGVTHVLPTFAMCCPLVLGAKQRSGDSFDYLPTFQGEEIFANYAQEAGRLDDYFDMLRRVVAQSPWPAIAVSQDYASRLCDEVGLSPQQLRVIYPGIELPTVADKPPFALLKEKMPDLREDVPIVTYFGRQDSEKGIDLLLYAVKMLQEQGIALQLVACGGTSFGLNYRLVCEQIAQHLRVRVMWKRRVSDELRSALYAHSRCIVYPSIHREPFGMVAAEAMSFGTPVIVPDRGGIAEVISYEGRAGGLTFKAWDSADLARQLSRLVTDEPLHAQLKSNTRTLAERFSVDMMTDRVLAHLGLTNLVESTAPATR